MKNNINATSTNILRTLQIYEEKHKTLFQHWMY